MSRQTEKIFKDLGAFLDANQADFENQEKMNALLQRFMKEANAKIASGRAGGSEPETADDWLELAERAPSRKKRLECLNKALELEPDNLDAGREKAEMTSKTNLELLGELSRLMENGTAQMEEEGFFSKDCKGNFWGILETRPYMRLRHSFMRILTQCGMFRRAARECEGMIELCEGDNLGVRYDLMHLYAMLEEEKPAKALMKKYSGDDETQMLLPLSILHFKLGQMDEALARLKRLCEINSDTKKFLKMLLFEDMETMSLPQMSLYGYRPYCIEELTVESSSYPFLFANSVAYFDWAYNALKKRTARKGKRDDEAAI